MNKLSASSRLSRASLVGITVALSALAAHGAVAADAPKHSDGLVSTVTDATITTQVKAKLLADASLRKSDISVSTFNGVTSLSGVATSAAAKSLAEAQARSVKDVKSVDVSALSVAGK